MQMIIFLLKILGFSQLLFIAQHSDFLHEILLSLLSFSLSQWMYPFFHFVQHSVSLASFRHHIPKP